MGSSNPQKRISRVLLLFLLLFGFNEVVLANDSYSAEPLPPRVSIWGYEGTLGLAKEDALIPLAGNDDNIFFSDIQSKYATDDSAFLGAALGFRHVISDSRIFGAYIFTDESRSAQHDNFWFVSPGIESLGNKWDFRSDAYIPISKTKQTAGTRFADQLNNYSFLYFTGHDQYDHIFDIYNQAGAGADAELGRVIPRLPNLRAYVGGYYFAIHDANNIKGAETRLEYFVNRHITLEATDSYDNVFHNSAELGVRLTIGGINNQPTATDIQTRILDPITRNLSTISSGTNIPIVNNYHDYGNLVLERGNIYFFSGNDHDAFNANAGTSNCTFEHPCDASQFNQHMVNEINSFASNANFYLSAGNYTLNGSLVLADGQSIFGRQDDFREPAKENNRPILSGSLVLNGNNKLDSLQLINNDTQAIGILINNANDIIINNSVIGGENNFESYQTAINLFNAHNITITNSLINTYKDLPDNDFTINGILAENSDINIYNSTINVVAKGDMTDQIQAYGINATASTININQSNINATASATATNCVDATDIEADSSIVKIYQSTMNVLAEDDATETQVKTTSTNIKVNNSDLTIENSLLDNHSVANGNDSLLMSGAIGIDETDSQVTANNNTFTIDASTDAPGLMTVAVGIYEDGGSLDLSNNIFNVTGTCNTIICVAENIDSDDNDLYQKLVNSKAKTKASSRPPFNVA